MSYKTEVKQSGKRQAMTNTFLRLNTRPDEYEIDKSFCGSGVDHCELCGNKIQYHFKLTHPKDLSFTNGRSLKIGGDCLVSYVEAFMPTRIQQFVDWVKDSVEKQKIKNFKAQYPTLSQEFKEFEELMRTYDVAYPWNPLKKLHKTQEAFKNKRLFVRHQYLTKPKIKAFREWFAEVKNYGPHLDSWKARTQQGPHFEKLEKMISAEKKDQVFYKDIHFYGQATGFPFKEDLPAYTFLDKMLFYEQLEIIKEQRSYRKNNFLKEIQKHPQAYGRALEKGPNSPYWSYLTKYQPLYLYSLRGLEQKDESLENLYENQTPYTNQNEAALAFLEELQKPI